MRQAVLCVILASCALDPAAGYEVSDLPIDEANAARAALQRADLVLTTDDAPAREYLGYPALVVQFGPNGHDVLLRMFTNVPRPTSSMGLYADIGIPTDIADTLAATGWDFTLPDDGTANGRFDGDVRGTVTRVAMRADADGLFFATIHVLDVAGATHVLTATGRMTGPFCTLSTGGSPTAPDDVAACNAIIGALRPPTERPRATD